ncbi:TPA: hypothetical protein ACGY8F_003083 [Stenotrophomonas maltophilia]|uniref:hypothetical protein n=1 Tax=Stenotrophomonas maltophilia TaxID=40324 RepID=UPI001311B025|nr:hypothetical protein [Stenotrophomonas maltophilia]
MFQTHWHLWLQQTLDSGWMLALMQFISLLGYEMAYTALILVCAFGARLRAGLCVMLAVLLMACATHAIKQGAALPRPSDVDARVLDEGVPSHPFVVNGGGQSFWSLPDAQSTASCARSPTPTMASTVAMWAWPPLPASACCWPSAFADAGCAGRWRWAGRC